MMRTVKTRVVIVRITTPIIAKLTTIILVVILSGLKIA